MNLLATVKHDNQDFEWYPTTDEIISRVYQWTNKTDSVLDIGAGDGRVLGQLTESRRYAIEKSVPLIEAMPADIIIIGTDFHQTTLIDKPVDVIFCNPPYSEYEQWAKKIILEAHARDIFLVLPKRWKTNPEIQAAIKQRGARVNELGRFDFLTADRQARAEVDLIKLSLALGWRDETSDPFNQWFESEFGTAPVDDKEEGEGQPRPRKATLREKLEKAVIGGRGRVPMLVRLYEHEMRHLYNNFHTLANLDADLLKELDADIGKIREALKQRITGLKNKYWQELFNNLDDITSRLTTKSRSRMLDRLTEQTNVDFTESNIYAVLIWVIKNANQYYDQQLIDTVEKMVSEANIRKYKSNQKLYQWDRWRYCRPDILENVSHYGLELRIVLDRYHAIGHGNHDYYYPQNLHNGAHDFINDLVTIANNLNFRTWSSMNSHRMGDWESGKTKEFYDADGKDLMWVRAFKNGNLHVKFNQKLIRALNVEFGRLKGWLKDKQQAADELNIPEDDAGAAFGANCQITKDNIKLLEN